MYKKNWELKKKCWKIFLLKITGKTYTSIPALLFRLDQGRDILVEPKTHPKNCVHKIKRLCIWYYKGTVRLLFRSSNFLCLVSFGDKVTKILHNLCLHFQGKMGKTEKNRKKVTQLEWLKYKRQKYGMKETFLTQIFSN